MSVKEVLDHALLGSETANFEFPLYTKTNQRVDILLNATTRRDVNGAVVGMIGVGQDITERKRVEREKTLVAQELQTFIDTANAPIIGIDAFGLVTEWNNKIAEITGFSKIEVMGKDLVAIYITEEFRESVRKVLVDALNGVEKSNFEFPLFTKTQLRVEILLNATSRRDVAGLIVGVIGVGQDITGMRRLMEQEALLFQLKAANDAKSQFLATMSHEMRTPLNVVLGMNELLFDTPLNDEQDKYCKQIEFSAKALLVLINDILDLTKIETGKLELRAVEFDLRTVLEDAMDSVAGQAMSKGLDLVCFLHPFAETRVISDPDRLGQILLNLLSNAIKFTDRGHVYVAVETEEQSESYITFRIKVQDTGIGVSTEGQRKLFCRFSQVDSSTTRGYGGTGLGLAISKQFAELMNGAMGVQSTQGKGSVFWFTVVLARAEIQIPIHREPQSVETASSVLIVASQEHLSNTLLRYSEAFGLTVQCEISLNEVQKVLETEIFNYLIFALEVQGKEVSKEDADRGMFRDLSRIVGIRKLHMNLHCVILCPVTQLGQASTYLVNLAVHRSVLWVICTFFQSCSILSEI